MDCEVLAVQAEVTLSPGACEHRSVSKDGRILCAKICQGDNSVSPGLCRACPARTVNCAHLRFSLVLFASSPLLVRFGGRSEVWNDGPARLSFCHAACAARVIPVSSGTACRACSLRSPLVRLPASPSARRPDARPGKVVPFPTRDSLAAAG